MKTNLSIFVLCLSLFAVQNVQASSMSYDCSNALGTVKLSGLAAGVGGSLIIVAVDYDTPKRDKKTYMINYSDLDSETVSSVEVHKEEGKNFATTYTVVKMKFKKKDGSPLPDSSSDGSRAEVMLCSRSASWM